MVCRRRRPYTRVLKSKCVISVRTTRYYNIIIVPNARNAAALVSRTRLDPVCWRTGGVGRAARAHGGVYSVRRPSAAADQWQPAAGTRSVRFSPVSGGFYYFYFLSTEVHTPTARQRLPRPPSYPYVNPWCVYTKYNIILLL